MGSFFVKHKRISAVLILCILSAGTVLSMTGCAGNDDFSAYTKTLFQEEISSNTLSMHYTISDPVSYEIDDYTVSLGDFSKENRQQELSHLTDIKQKLSSFSHSRLSDENDLTLDVLNSYIDTQIALSDYSLYKDPLLPSGGDAIFVPLLFAEYSFDSARDITEYFALLRQFPDYLLEILEFEQEKAGAGLFMSDAQCQNTLSQLESYIKNPKEHSLLLTFSNRIKDFSLSQSEKDKLLEENESIFEKKILPAYKSLIQGLSSLMGCGRNSSGLCNFPEGKAYYTALVQSYTGLDATIEEITTMIENARAEDFATCSNLIAAHPNLLETCSSYEWNYTENTQIFQTLAQKMKKDFPAAPDYSCNICYVDPSLKDYFAPAFYITSPMDDYLENTIYINSASDYPDIYYFTTLAHEGIPGHMYQTIMSYQYGLPPIRSILNFPGYTEGWATYVELLSFSYTGLEENLTDLLMHNQAATLSLYATSDIGIHYYNWDKEKLYAFWNQYGVSDKKSIDSIRDLILNDPGNYLKYYVGYLNFRNLRYRMMQTYKDSFSLMAFHEALLRIGPAPFSVVEKYLPEYYEKAAQ